MKQQTTGCGRLFALAAFTASIWAVAETVSAAPSYSFSGQIRLDTVFSATDRENMVNQRGNIYNGTPVVRAPPAASGLVPDIVIRDTPPSSNDFNVQQMRAEFDLGAIQSSLFTSSVLLGFVLGTLISAFFGLADRVDLARRVTELGRAARAEAKVRTRQPLRRALVASTAHSRLGDELRAQGRGVDGRQPVAHTRVHPSGMQHRFQRAHLFGPLCRRAGGGHRQDHCQHGNRTCGSQHSVPLSDGMRGSRVLPRCQ